MTNITQELAVIDPGKAWLLPLPKNGFTVPIFRFGQRVQSQSRGTSVRIIGMEFAPKGSKCARQIALGWHYVIELGAYRYDESPRLEDQDLLPESDLKLIQ